MPDSRPAIISPIKAPRAMISSGPNTRAPTSIRRNAPRSSNRPARTSIGPSAADCSPMIVKRTIDSGTADTLPNAVESRSPWRTALRTPSSALRAVGDRVVRNASRKASVIGAPAVSRPPNETAKAP